MQNCIYCGAPADAREHWIPRGLGRFKGYEPLLDRLCEGCNQCLGRELDEEFLRTGEIGFKREIHGIRGRTGHQYVSPLAFRAAQADQPTTMQVPAEGGTHSLHVAPARQPSGELHTRFARQVVVRTHEGGTAAVMFPRPWGAEQLRAALHARQLDGAELVEIFVDEDEILDERAAYNLRALLTAVFGTFGVNAYGGVDGTGSVRPTDVIAGISRKYIRALAKVGFHYFLWTSTLFRGDEQCFREVREFIRADEGDWRQIVQMDAEEFLMLGADPDKRVRPESLSHVFLTTTAAEEAVARLQFFLAPDAGAPVTRVRLASNPPLRFRETKQIHCHRASYTVVEGHDGELVRVDAWERRITIPSR